MLNGQTVLIVEAEFLIALDIQRMLETLMAGPPAFPGAPVVVKPMVEDAFHGAVTQALDQSSRTNGYGS